MIIWKLCMKRMCAAIAVPRLVTATLIKKPSSSSSTTISGEG